MGVTPITEAAQAVFHEAAERRKPSGKRAPTIQSNRATSELHPTSPGGLRRSATLGVFGLAQIDCVKLTNFALIANICPPVLKDCRRRQPFPKRGVETGRW
jgi:hypothetical protein